MFDDETLGSQVLANPAMVQGLVLTEFQNRLGGIYVVADPNNAFNLQLEAASSMNAQTVRAMRSSFDVQYPVRATTAKQLYNSMSDFDYLNMVAGPCATTLNLTFDIDFLIKNAQSFDATYNRVVIPQITQFYVGPLTFGIYYPINININKVTGNINVLWDTTNTNPLWQLPSNMVPFTQFRYGGLNLVTLQIPVSQFAQTTSTYPVVSSQGFIRNISYTDQFYAARVFTNLPTNGWTELAYTLSETVYDPTTPTAKLVIQSDTNVLTVSIPQIYFTNNQIGTQVQVVLYTTKGEITLDLTSVEINNSNVSFGIGQPSVTAYSALLANMPTISLIPAETLITGGSNALPFAQLRDLVVNGGLYTSAPVTPTQLEAFANKSGFSITKYIDNITDRIYYASNTIQGGANGYIMTTMGAIDVNSTAALSCSTIIDFAGDDATTILPTTIYSYNAATNVCTPLTDAQAAYLTGLTGQFFCDAVNDTTYTKCPFHVVTYTSAQYPVTKSFNLMNPTATQLTFITDNTTLTPQMSVSSAVVIHNNNGTGGYTLRLGVVKTPAMAQIAENNITVLLTTTDSNGNTSYGVATLQSTTPALYIYEMPLPTNYYITETGTIMITGTSLTSLKDLNGNPTAVGLPLASTFSVSFLLSAAYWASSSTTVKQNTDVISNIPPAYQSMLGVSRQTLLVTLGKDLSDQVFNITNATYSATSYMTYPETVYRTYDQDVYEKDIHGGLVYTIIDGAVVLNKLHSRGDQILDGSGNPQVLHYIGSIQYDSFGNPLVYAQRSLQYFTKSIMFDIRLFYSQNTVDVNFAGNLTSYLAGYLDTISALQNQLLEQTQLYYIPKNTMGTAVFSAGNNVPLTLNLGFSFMVTLYVTQATLANPTLQNSIDADTLSIIQTEMSGSIISLTDIATSIKAQLSDAVKAVDVDGIDGNIALQTVIVPNDVVNPIIAQQLVWDDNAGVMTLKPNVTIKYALAA